MTRIEQIRQLLARERGREGGSEPWIVSVDCDSEGDPTGFGRVFEGEHELGDYMPIETCEFLSQSRDGVADLLTLWDTRDAAIRALVERWRKELDGMVDDYEFATLHKCVDALDAILTETP